MLLLISSSDAASATGISTVSSNFVDDVLLWSGAV